MSARHQHDGNCEAARAEGTKPRLLSNDAATSHCFRLGFSSIRTDRIQAGLKRLESVIARR
jgi:GntR family transcriptional regulator/MocR family aminotransferase